MAMSLRVIVPPHPLIGHWLTILREDSTPPPIYATALEELGKWLTYEALRDWLPHRKEEVQTSNGPTEGVVIEANVPLISFPILPGGIELWQGARNVLPNNQLCLGGIPKEICAKAGIIIFVDQIASEKTLLDFLIELKAQNILAKRIRVITALASAPGLSYIAETWPDLTIYAACIDPEVSDNNVINPGIGNPLLRLNTIIAGPN